MTNNHIYYIVPKTTVFAFWPKFVALQLTVSGQSIEVANCWQWSPRQQLLDQMETSHQSTEVDNQERQRRIQELMVRILNRQSIQAFEMKYGLGAVQGDTYYRWAIDALDAQALTGAQTTEIPGQLTFGDCLDDWDNNQCQSAFKDLLKSIDSQWSHFLSSHALSANQGRKYWGVLDGLLTFCLQQWGGLCCKKDFEKLAVNIFWQWQTFLSDHRHHSLTGKEMSDYRQKITKALRSNYLLEGQELTDDYYRCHWLDFGHLEPQFLLKPFLLYPDDDPTVIAFKQIINQATQDGQPIFKDKHTDLAQSNDIN